MSKSSRNPTRRALLQRLSWSAGSTLNIGGNDNAWTAVSLNLENEHEAIAVILGLGGDVIVDTPATLRAAARRDARQLLTNNPT